LRTTSAQLASSKMVSDSLCFRVEAAAAASILRVLKRVSAPWAKFFRFLLFGVPHFWNFSNGFIEKVSFEYIYSYVFDVQCLFMTPSRCFSFNSYFSLFSLIFFPSLFFSNSTT